MINKLIINLIGSPGTRKSTIASGLFHSLRITQPQPVELVHEGIKAVVYERGALTIHDQIRGLVAQSQQEYGKLKSSMILIVDCPSLLSALYCSRCFGSSILKSDSVWYRLWKDIYHPLQIGVDVIWVHTRPVSSDQYSQVGRIESYSQSMDIDEEIRELLKRVSGDYPSHEIMDGRFSLEDLRGKIGRFL